MSSQDKPTLLAEDTEDVDGEVAAMVQAQPQPNGDQNQWLGDKLGDLDWAYTAHVVRKWSHDALLTHIWEKAFSVPARDYSPSAPFVYIKMHDGEVVTLPHGYRSPLLFVAKYYWGITLSNLKTAQSWKRERANVFHLSRLCENLFQQARAKTFAGGMEKGWRCLMFDRLLARFYKGWYRNDPPSETEFVTKFGAKEYDRDVLKHDWKRWCGRGLNGIKMAESEVVDGITIAQYREGLDKCEDGLWRLNGGHLSFVTVEEDLEWSSVSDLTEIDMDDEDEIVTNPGGNIGPHDNGDITLQTLHSPEVTASPEKRVRPLLVDEDELERASKRARIEDFDNGLRSPNNIANVATTRLWATSFSGFGSQSDPHVIDSSPPPTASSSSFRPNEHSTTSFLPSSNHITPRWTIPISVPPRTITPSNSIDGASISSPLKQDASPRNLESVVVISRPPKTKQPVFSRSLSSVSARGSGSSSRTDSSSKITMEDVTRFDSGHRPSGSKLRQTKASRSAGVATVNVYVPDGKRRASFQSKASVKPKMTSPRHRLSRSPSPSNPPIHGPPPHLSPAATRPPSPIVEPLHLEALSITPPTVVSTLPTEPMVTSPILLPTPASVTPATHSISTITTPPANETQPTLSRDVITAKALELLVNLVDTKQILSNAFNPSASTSSIGAKASTDVNLNPPHDGKHLELIQNLEERFSSVKGELKDIIGRLEDLEKESSTQRALTMVKERVLEDKTVECRPVMVSLGVETDRSEVLDLAKNNILEDVVGRDAEGDVKMISFVERVLGEMAVQTEEEERDRSQQPDLQPEDSSKGEQTPIQEVVALPAVEIPTVDRNCGSETDTDSTVNLAKDESFDPRSQEISENLSLLVNNLVSAKMLSVVGDMVKGKARESPMVDLETSLPSMSPVTAPWSDSFSLTSLRDEIRSLKEESRARDVREKEEMQAMRQLHSAEVDALRRRLSYLESQNHNFDPVPSISGDRYRSSEGGRHVRPPRHSDTTPWSSFSATGDVERTSSLDSIPTTNPRTKSSVTPVPTPAHSEHSFSFGQSHDRDDELPLPSKSKRKQNISFPRAPFT